MSDLVERLRTWRIGVLLEDDPEDLMSEAADRIAALEARVQELAEDKEYIIASIRNAGSEYCEDCDVLISPGIADDYPCNCNITRGEWFLSPPTNEE